MFTRENSGRAKHEIEDYFLNWDCFLKWEKVKINKQGSFSDTVFENYVNENFNYLYFSNSLVMVKQYFKTTPLHVRFRLTFGISLQSV